MKLDLSQLSRRKSLPFVAMWLAACQGSNGSEPGPTPEASCTTPVPEDDDPAHLFEDGGGVAEDGGGFITGDSGTRVSDAGGPGEDGGVLVMPDGGGPPGFGTSDDTPNEPVTNDFGTAYTVLHGFAELTKASPSAALSLDVALGINARVCETCHSVGSGWTVRPSSLATFFSQSNNGGDTTSVLSSIFLPVDGSNSPAADLSTPATRQAAFSMLLARGVIRVELQPPSNAEFSVTAVDDPYGHAMATSLSLFRRIPEVANLRFLTDVMWDGRETQECQTLQIMLEHQANDAALGHMQAPESLPEATVKGVAARERIIYFAQLKDNAAGDLSADGANGGPLYLVSLPFYAGINAYPGPDPMGKAFNQRAFTIFDAWASSSTSTSRGAARASIARGQEIFNTKTFQVSGVRGLNDDLGQSMITATCTTCHNTPNVGNDSLSKRFDIGISDASRRSPQLPLYTLKNGGTGETLESTDPGRAMISGAWRDVGRFKVPSLRGLSNRAPYFHDGSAPALLDVVSYLDNRFAIGLTDGDKRDLVAFLSAL
jgi:cytochrome c peroxidase